MLLSPTRELLEEPLRGANAPQVRLGNHAGELMNAGDDTIYGFNDAPAGAIDEEELTEWIAESEALVDGLGLRTQIGEHNMLGEAIAAARGAPGIPLANGGELIDLDIIPGGGGGAVAGYGGGGGANLIGDAVAELRRTSGNANPGWMIASGCGDVVGGLPIDGSCELVSLGDKGVARLPGGGIVFVIRKGAGHIGQGDQGAGLSSTSAIAQLEGERIDSRVLPIQRDLHGRRYQDFKAVVDKLLCGKASDSPIAGPVSVGWLLRFMYANGGSPTAFHQRYISELRLDYTAAGMSEHMILCKFFELITCFDFIDPSQSVACELLARKLQIIHDRWKHKGPNFGVGGGTQGGDDDSFLMLGTYETRGNIGVCPELSSFIGSEVSKTAASDKERRKAREERALQVAENKTKR